MKAGRELDALIAEKVMGCVLCDKWRMVHVSMSGGDWMKGDCNHDECRPAGFGPPHYSTQIADAWLVVDKLGEMGWYVTLFRTRCYWKVVLGHYPYEAVPEIKKHNPETHEGIGPYIEAPLAICLAALKAVE